MSKNNRLLEFVSNILYYHIRESDNMIHPSIDKLLNKVGSKYLLVNIVSSRAKQMQETEHYQMKENEYKSKKPIGRALEEIAKDLINVKED